VSLHKNFQDINFYQEKCITRVSTIDASIKIKGVYICLQNSAISESTKY